MGERGLRSSVWFMALAFLVSLPPSAGWPDTNKDAGRDVFTVSLRCPGCRFLASDGDLRALAAAVRGVPFFDVDCNNLAFVAASTWKG